MAQENLPVVHVINGRQKKLLQGHPWVYGNEIERVEGETQDGGLVTVVEFRGRYMGTGVYNSRSLITVRLLTHRQEEIT
ncbi:MAG: rRNA large subunit methyltransferase I, partial [Candidatus Ventricola sp.]|nr:rRNA large subunit methyltransferase I [Candidatus Ventricola sp.]